MGLDSVLIDLGAFIGGMMIGAVLLLVVTHITDMYRWLRRLQHGG